MKPIQTRSGNAQAICIGLSVCALILSCSKSSSNMGTPSKTTSGNAYVSFTDVSPIANSYSVYSDNTNIYPSGTVGYGYSTGIVNGSPYETVTDSTHSIYILNNGVKTNIDSAVAFQDSGYYSLFYYDTGANAKTVALRDYFSSPPPSGDADIRFLNFSPNSTNLNIQLMSLGTGTVDSFTYNNVAFIGNSTLTTDSLQSFQSVMAGSYKILVNSGLTNLFTDDSVSLTAGKFYTIFVKGYVNGNNGADSLGVGIIQNF